MRATAEAVLISVLRIRALIIWNLALDVAAGKLRAVYADTEKFVFAAEVRKQYVSARVKQEQHGDQSQQWRLPKFSNV